jgi:hypothetical protein
MEVRHAQLQQRPPFRPTPCKPTVPIPLPVWLSLPEPVQQRTLQTLGRIVAEHLVTPPVAKEVKHEAT